MEKMKFLVTGGCGFVGSYLVEQLVGRGNDVSVVDHLSNGSMKNIESVKDKISFYNYNVQDIKPTTFPIKFDGIFHLATHPRSNSFTNPLQDIEINCKGMIRVLELAKENNSKVVFTSNAGIYSSMDAEIPITENYPDRPSTPYDANKLVSEYYCKIYHKAFGIRCAIVRFATVYGYKQKVNEKLNWKPLVATFINQMLENKQVYINGDGHQTRDLVYVKDAVQGVIGSMDSKVENADVSIISSDTETSILQVFQIIKEKIKYKKEPIFNEPLLGDIRRMRYSYKKAEHTRGYKPRFDLDYGISELIKLWKENN